MTLGLFLEKIISYFIAIIFNKEVSTKLITSIFYKRCKSTNIVI